MAYELPNLPYDYNALEPYLDEQTLRIHHGKHHATYLANLNKAIEGHPDLANKDIHEILAHLSSIPEGIRTAVINNGGGHANHCFFWTSMAPPGKGGGGQPGGELAKAIDSTFSSFEKFKEAFSDKAAKHFASGWAWLEFDKTGKLIIESTPNHDTPISKGHKPILILDVWEHAYYLKYQNRRAEFIAAWWNVVNWPVVAERFARFK